MSNVTRRGAVKPSMNITPLIDVVFLLIVFFMIVNNIVTDEVPPLQLPDLIEPETYQAEGESRVIVNIIPMQEFEPENDGRPGPGFSESQVLSRSGSVRAVSIGGLEFDVEVEGKLDEFKTRLAETIASRTSNNGGKPPMIMLRADAGVYYSSVLPIMNLMQVAMAEALDPEVAAGTPIHLVAYLEE